MSKQHKQQSQAVWDASPAGTTFARGAKPGTKEFFERVLKKRSEYEQPWLFEIISFAEMRDKKVLELGCGAGYDAYEFCRQSANYTGIDIATENPKRTQQHLAYYNYEPKVIRGDVENLMFPDETFDVVFSNGVLHHTPHMEKSFQEAYRVLKPGGEFNVILYHRNSIFYWLTVGLYNTLDVKLKSKFYVMMGHKSSKNDYRHLKHADFKEFRILSKIV
ncbi:MAG: class I SAM-dependent methyltransferase [Phototrophicaceae bacterium]